MHFALTNNAAYWATLRPEDDFPRHLECGARLHSVADGWLCPTCEMSGGLLKPTYPDQSSPFHRTVLDAASWRLASDLALRHPDLRVYRTFPHPGTSDVLMIVPEGYGPIEPRGPVIYLNRDHGRIHVLRRSDDMEVEGGPWTWDDYLTSNGEGPTVIEQIEHAAGVREGQEDKPPSIEGMVYDLVARIAALALLEEPYDISNGYVDQFYPADWWEEMATRAPEVAQRRPNDLAGQPGFRFWRIARHGFSLTVETSTATMWQEEHDPDEADLLGYDEGEALLADLLSPNGNRRALEAALELGQL